MFKQNTEMNPKTKIFLHDEENDYKQRLQVAVLLVRYLEMERQETKKMYIVGYEGGEYHRYNY